MAKLTYSEQLKHPNWQRKRLEMLNAANFECQFCGDKEKMLHVHHKQYFKGRMAWEYEDSELEVLCEDCHQSKHDSMALLNELLASSSSGLDVVLGLAAGYLMASMDVDLDIAERISVGRELYFEIGIAASTLDRGDGLPWRKHLIDQVKKFHPNPITKHYAELWASEENTDAK